MTSKKVDRTFNVSKKEYIENGTEDKINEEKYEDDYRDYYDYDCYDEINYEEEEKNHNTTYYGIYL